MSETQKRPTARRPCEAEAIWFDISDLFYRELNRNGERAALLVARRALDAIRPPADTQPRAALTSASGAVAPENTPAG